MPDHPLQAWGKRWDKKLNLKVAFDPTDEELTPGVIPLGIPAVDIMLGGGIPLGRTTVLIGEPSSGKTLFAQLVIASAQRRGGVAMFFDLEKTYDEGWFKLTGVDTDPKKLIIVRPRNLEQAIDLAVDALETVKPAVIVVDSIPAMIPKGMLTDNKGKLIEMEHQDFRGLAARKITEGVAKLTSYNQSAALIFINQLRISMGVTFGNPESMPGGKGLRFFASLLIRVRRGAWLHNRSGGAKFDPDADADEEDNGGGDLEKGKEKRRTGFMLRLRTDKSKVAPPWQETELKFYFDGTLDPLESLVKMAIERGFITGKKGFFHVPGIEKTIHGIGAVEELVRIDEDLKDSLIRKITGEDEAA